MKKMIYDTEIPKPGPLPPAATAHLPVVAECLVEPRCPKISFDLVDNVERCLAYLDPAKVQHRCGRLDACAIKPRPVKDNKKKPVLKRKFGSRTR